MFEVIQIEDRRICFGYFIPFVFPNSIACAVASHAGHESQRRPTGIQLFFGLSVFSRNRQCHIPLLQEHLLKKGLFIDSEHFRWIKIRRQSFKGRGRVSQELKKGNMRWWWWETGSVFTRNEAGLCYFVYKPKTPTRIEREEEVVKDFSEIAAWQHWSVWEK